MDEKVEYATLFEVYAKLLTERQREIGEMYFFEDLSLGEIAELVKISRQSVNDALKTVKNELNSYEEKLKLCKIKNELREFASTLDEKSIQRLTEIIDN